MRAQFVFIHHQWCFSWLLATDNGSFDLLQRFSVNLNCLERPHLVVVTDQSCSDALFLCLISIGPLAGQSVNPRFFLGHLEFSTDKMTEIVLCANLLQTYGIPHWDSALWRGIVATDVMHQLSKSQIAAFLHFEGICHGLVISVLDSSSLKLQGDKMAAHWIGALWNSLHYGIHGACVDWNTV